jgi:hypothetical protein
VGNLEKSTTYATNNTEKDTTWSITGLDGTNAYSTTNINPSTDFLFFTNFKYNLNTATWNSIQTIWGR